MIYKMDRAKRSGLMVPPMLDHMLMERKMELASIGGVMGLFMGESGLRTKLMEPYLILFLSN
jgi:hypothetical protein